MAPFYGSLTYFYLRWVVFLSVSTSIWHTNCLTYKLFKNFPEKDTNPHGWCHFEDVANMFSNFDTVQIENLFSQMSIYQRPVHAERLHIIIHTNERKYDAIIKLKLPWSIKDCRSFCGMVNFLSPFCKDLRRHLYQYMRYRKGN